ncbi:MAG: hypothetical protein A2831_02545 [Candidatus Yanofskybacteria bacterium RIFCSPHIGHO2_01_FULL_44_17]|uniref:Glycosyltransferase RgtA/B/C/D-like domain-containing protein n=1 Tax=Candidatus Yanofskybacteria bacterium RIFCSPHIGHO2_01_FULL_44_17 TaxID=1802668 RepID=A0A1F8EX37_9BACT|nr:MAG: hypothetical protein A2831_02545 [Candidatus Yanofskybacteria bacterium RIFCSPHIGHO2_01_FULL_44_17]
MSLRAVLSKNKAIILIVLAVIGIKLVLFFWSVYNFDFIVQPHNTWWNIWVRWDAGVYIRIASAGYSSVGINQDFWSFLSHFPPLYSLLMSGLSRLFHLSLAGAGLLISFISIICGSALLYKLVKLESADERAAWAAVIFLNLYPTSYFTGSVYSESLFLFLAISSFYFLKKERFILSGAAAAMAILARFIGVVFLLVYLLYFLYFCKINRKVNFRAAFPFLLALAGSATQLLINKIYFGSYLYFINDEVSFNATKHLIIPLSETYHDFLAVFHSSNFFDQAFMMNQGWNAIFTLAALIITLIGLNKIKWQYSAYAVCSILIFSSLAWGISNARYTLSVFPIFMVLGLNRNKYLVGALSIISVMLLFYFTRIFTSGSWAF